MQLLIKNHNYEQYEGSIIRKMPILLDVSSTFSHHSSVTS